MPARSKFIWSIIGACVAAAVLSVAFLYGSMRWRNAHDAVETYEVIARAKGWSYGSRDDSTATVERLTKDPATVVDLLCHDSRKVREAVNSVGRELQFPTEMLDRLGDRLPTLPEYKQYNVARFLSDQGPAGLHSLFKVFDRRTSIPDRPDLRELLRHAMVKVDRDELQRLLKVAADETKPLVNRLLAIELIGFTNDSPWLITELKLLDDRGDLEIRRTVRVAILRLTDSFDPERLTADLEWYRANEPWSVANFLLETARFGEAAHAFGPSALAELEAHNPDTVAAAAMTLAMIGYGEAIPELIRTLDSDDWLAVGSAAKALGRLHAQTAEAPLRKTEREHWNASVREVAAQAIEAIRHQSNTAESADGRMVSAIGKLSALPGALPKPKPASSWSRRFDAASEFIEKLRVEFVRLTAPAYDQMEVAWPDGRRLNDQAYDMRPRHRLRFGHGVLLGYNEGEFGAGLAYVPDRGTAVFYPLSNVTQLTRWQGKVVVITTTLGDNKVWLFEPSKDSAPKVKFFKRLPLFFDQCTNDSQGNLNFSDVLQITRAGELKRI